MLAWRVPLGICCGCIRSWLIGYLRAVQITSLKKQCKRFFPAWPTKSWCLKANHQKLGRKAIQSVIRASNSNSFHCNSQASTLCRIALRSSRINVSSVDRPPLWRSRLASKNKAQRSSVRVLLVHHWLSPHRVQIHLEAHSHRSCARSESMRASCHLDPGSLPCSYLDC